VIVYQRSQQEILGKNIIIWQDEIKKHHNANKAEIIDSNDPLFILYTS